MSDQITEDVEVITGLPMLADTSTVMAIARAEIDSQIATARQYPRNMRAVQSMVTQLATMDEEAAEECCYVLTRKSKQKGKAGGEEDKTIEGPSIRLAEIAAQRYGNCRIEARVVSVNRQEKYVEAEGIFHDLETNMASKATVRRRISTKTGYLFSEDMILVVSNAACAIAKRNAILAGIPKAIYRPAYQAARRMLAGDVTTLAENRDRAIKAFQRFGVTAEQLFEALGVEGEASVTPEHIATLRGMYGTLTRGEETVEAMFAKPTQEHKVVENPLSDDGGEEITS